MLNNKAIISVDALGHKENNSCMTLQPWNTILLAESTKRPVSVRGHLSEKAVSVPTRVSYTTTKSDQMREAPVSCFGFQSLLGSGVWRSGSDPCICDKRIDAEGLPSKPCSSQ